MIWLALPLLYCLTRAMGAVGFDAAASWCSAASWVLMGLAAGRMLRGFMVGSARARLPEVPDRETAMLSIEGKVPPGYVLKRVEPHRGMVVLVCVPESSPKSAEVRDDSPKSALPMPTLLPDDAPAPPAEGLP